MSARTGLLERIIRGRRASAGERPGSKPQNGAAAVPANNAAEWVSEEELRLDPLPHAPPEPPPPAPAPQAAGSPDPRPAPPRPASRTERLSLRRRVAYLRRLRELQLRDLGGFVLELHRFDRRRPDLVQAKLAEVARTDQELRALERALDENRPLQEIRQPGIGGACANCGAVHGSTDRFCSWCGRSL